MEVAEVLKKILESELPIYSSSKGVHYTANSGKIITGIDFTHEDPGNIAHSMFEAVAKGYLLTLESIGKKQNISGSFLNYNEKLGRVDWITIEGKRTKVGVKISSLEVITPVALHDDESFQLVMPHFCHRMTDLYIAPKSTSVETMKIGDFFHHHVEVTKELTKSKYDFTISEVIGFEGYVKDNKPEVPEKDVTSMISIATEALSLYDPKVYIKKDRKDCHMYSLSENMHVLIHRNFTSTTLEWEDGPLKRVILYKDKVVFSTWAWEWGAGVKEMSRTMDKSDATLNQFKKALLVRKLSNT